jgi:hypothetical protein
LLDHSEFYKLSDEVPHRATEQPHEDRICQTAYRTADKLENMLKSPQSRMLFVRCIADFFELSVDLDVDCVLLRIPPTDGEESSVTAAMPDAIEMQPDCRPRPVDCELKNEGEASFPV